MEEGAGRQEYLSPQMLAQLASQELRAKMIVEGMMSGTHRSPYQGMAVEFAEHRQYAPGDDTRHMDWRVYGRTDKLYIKRYQQETNLDVVLLVDASASMGYGSLIVKEPVPTDGGRKRRRWTKLDHATAIAAAFAYFTLHQQDRVGLAVFGDEVRLLLERSGAQGHWRRLVAALSAEPARRGTDFAKAIEQVLSKIRNKALFIIVSDFFDDAGTINRALARFRHHRHDVILLNTLDRQEMRFALSQPVSFVGMENEGELRVDPRALRDAYLAALGGHLDVIARRALSFGFDYHRLDTHDSVGPPLAYALARRNAIIKRSGLG
jgi:uncharacterized protein (DUF58 family)